MKCIAIATLLALGHLAFGGTLPQRELCVQYRQAFLANIHGGASNKSLAKERKLQREVHKRDLFGYCESVWY